MSTVNAMLRIVCMCVGESCSDCSLRDLEFARALLTQGSRSSCWPWCARWCRDSKWPGQLARLTPTNSGQDSPMARVCERVVSRPDVSLACLVGIHVSSRNSIMSEHPREGIDHDGVRAKPRTSGCVDDDLVCFACALMTWRRSW